MSIGIYLASRRPNVGIRNSIIRTEDGEGERSAWGVRRGRTRAVRYILRLYVQYMMHDTSRSLFLILLAKYMVAGY